MPDAPRAKACDRAEMLRREIGKVRCWLTGFHAGRGTEIGSIPGEDSLRQVQQFLTEIKDTPDAE